MKTRTNEIDRAALKQARAEPQTKQLHRKEHASAERRDMAAMFEEAKSSGIVETPSHVRNYRRRKKELDLMNLEC